MSSIKNRLIFENAWEIGINYFVGALLVGALRPTNTWDYPVFLVIACLSILFSFLKYSNPKKDLFPSLDIKTKKILSGVLLITGFGLLSYILFNSFSKWYGQGYSKIAFWSGDKTPLGSFLTHWGLFIFIIYSWMITEIVEWMKATPLSALNRFYSFRILILFGFTIVIAVLIILVWQSVAVSLLIIPVAVLSLLMMFRKNLSDEKRFMLLLISIGMGLILLVEVIVLSGDIGRMNTVFKFYLQAWSCLAISASWCLISLVKRRKKWKKQSVISGWTTFLVLLILSVILFPIIASVDKINDRIAEKIPLTLDGMEYMKYSTYDEEDQLMDLNEDYQLIRWMQDNILGTPIIIEGHVPEYRWGNRISVYTGLPGVIGWNWHQRQQRAINPSDWVFERVNDVETFYSTEDISQTKKLISKYNIEYIIIGQLENIIYPQKGFEKFRQDSEGVFDEIYISDNTSIIRVVLGE